MATIRVSDYLDSDPCYEAELLQLKTKDFAHAAIYLERAARMDPGNFITHHLLGELYRNLGKMKDAERELKTAEEIQSSQHLKIDPSQ